VARKQIAFWPLRYSAALNQLSGLVQTRLNDSKVNEEPSVNNWPNAMAMLKLEPGDCDVSSVAQETIRGSGVITPLSQRDLDLSQMSLVKLSLLFVTVCRHYGILRILTFLVRATDRCANDRRQGNQHYDRVPQDPFQREHAHSFLLQFVTLSDIGSSTRKLRENSHLLMAADDCVR
jgi:hypothetical protein